jgi:acyl carrier protein
MNLYGPTETIVSSTGLTVDAGNASGPGGMVPIGHALAGRSAWVLDPYGNPAPAGVDGELCLGGRLLARGYLGRPGLTAERFVPDPFAGEPGERLYRTGDLARRRSDGILEFRGRVDRQLKVRGFRVEPGEIESALARYPGIREAVVDARPGPGGDPRLVAWVVPADPAPSAGDLAGFLRGTLPDHLIPSAFVPIRELPLTANGKLDRRALPDPAAPSDGGPEAGPSPRTPAEERLAGIWRQLLGVSRIGVQDDFFALGGHSLLATRLLSRIRDAFGIQLSLRELFSATTLEKLAERIERDGPGEALRAGLAIPEPAGERPRLWPASFSQRSLWFVDRLQPAGGAYNLSTPIRFAGGLDVALLDAALAGLVFRHEALRTRFVEIDGEPWQEILPAERPALPLIDLSNLPLDGAEAESLRLTYAEADRPFDLAAGPLLRAHLFRLAPEEHLFLLTIHHAVTDGWSDDLLVRDLAALYAAGAEGRAAELPPLPVQYAEYAAWQREELKGEALEESIAVWTRRLAGVPPLDLPADRQRPPVWTFRGDLRSAPLEKIPAAELERQARAHGATPFMLLLAGLQVLLGRYTGQDDFAVGTPTANRTRSELENVVGFFVNMLPLRAGLSGGPGFHEVLGRVRDTALEAFSHQGVPFDLLVERLAPQRDLGRNPIFQVALQLIYRGASTSGGARPSSISTSPSPSKSTVWRSSASIRPICTRTRRSGGSWATSRFCSRAPWPSRTAAWATCRC